jgi:hypothetical protein
LANGAVVTHKFKLVDFARATIEDIEGVGIVSAGDASLAVPAAVLPPGCVGRRGRVRLFMEFTEEEGDADAHA